MVLYSVEIVFDGYDDPELIGEGGLGRVYRAIRASTGGTVAIKSLRDVQDSSPAWHRANRELEAMLRVKGHPYVVTVEEIFLGPEGPCLVMEYLQGGSIADLLAAGPIPDADLVLIGQHVSQALIAAHEVGIVHRDIKPANLMIGGFGQVKVGDFGISALARGDDQTKTSSLTLAYASPEELDGEQRVGAPADVFSLAATMHHLVSGIRPTFSARVHGWPPLVGRDPAVAPMIASIEAGLSEAIDDRPTMEEMSAAFDRSAMLLGERAIKRLPVGPRPDDSVTVAHSKPTPQQAPTATRRTPALIVGGVIALLVLVVVGVLALGGGDDDPDPNAAPTTAAQTVVPEPEPESTDANTIENTSVPEVEPEPEPAPSLDADGVLQLTAVFDASGEMAAVAIAPTAGAALAVDDINAAGGVLGEAVDFSVELAFDPAGEIPDVVIGPLVSNDDVIAIIREAGALVITPSVPDDRFNGDGFVRMVASNSAQARAIVTQMTDDGVRTVGIVGIAGGAPQSITDAAADAAVEAGIEVVHERSYDPDDAADLAAIAQELLDDGPDAVLIAGFEDDTAAIINAVASANGDLVPFALYGTAANTGGGLAALVASPAHIEGMAGTFLAGAPDEAFLERVGPLDDATYAAEAYDAVVLAALAAIADDSDAAGSIADQIIDVSRSGMACTEFTECAALLDDGVDIDYQGRSGAVDLTDDSELAAGSVLVFRYDAIGEFVFERMISQA